MVSTKSVPTLEKRINGDHNRKKNEENGSGEGTNLRYRFGPLNYHPLARVDFENNQIILSEEDKPDISHQKREWNLTDWFNYFAFKQNAPTTTEVYHHKPPIKRHKIENANSFRITEERYKPSNCQDPIREPRFFVHYDML